VGSGPHHRPCPTRPGLPGTSGHRRRDPGAGGRSPGGLAGRLDLAWVLHDLGRAAARSGEHAGAERRLRAALDLAHHCGAVRLQAQARRGLVELGRRPRRAASTGVEALTGSERRVAELAATGCTNRQIAQLLFVTERTVEVHLTSAYRKLGIRSRRDLPPTLRRR
jgi:DNA-binding CsgD family transcriptional regulator